MVWRAAGFALALALVTAKPATAQVLMGSYYAEIGPQDRRNSSGASLSDPGGILQQDRANVHRFGIRHPGDQIDDRFDNPESRAMLPDLFRQGQHGAGVDADLLGQGAAQARLIVLVCGDGASVTHVVVDRVGGAQAIGCSR